MTGSRNLRTSRSVNGALSSRTHFSGVPHLVTSSRPPAGDRHLAAAVAEHQRVVAVGVDSIAIIALGLVTIGRANSAWALLGTTEDGLQVRPHHRAPAENAYAVDPVGLDTSTPSQPKADTGLPSISRTTPSTPGRGPSPDWPR